MTAGTRYFNGVREFTLYFVEYLRPCDFGDRSTTLVLKALELCCRFRFLFLEKNIEFSHMNIRIALPTTFHALVQNIERELNLLRRDAIETGLDKPNIWADFVDWEHLQKMSEEWRPLTQIRAVQEDSLALPGLRNTLATAIEQVEDKIRPLNTLLICGLTNSLKKFCDCP